MLRRSSPRLGMPGPTSPACLQGMVLVKMLALQPTTSDAVSDLHLPQGGTMNPNRHGVAPPISATTAGG